MFYQVDYSLCTVNLLMLLWMCVWLWMLSAPCLLPCVCIFYITRGNNDTDWLLCRLLAGSWLDVLTAWCLTVWLRCLIHAWVLSGFRQRLIHWLIHSFTHLYRVWLFIVRLLSWKCRLSLSFCPFLPRFDWTRETSSTVATCGWEWPPRPRTPWLCLVTLGDWRLLSLSMLPMLKSTANL